MKKVSLSVETVKYSRAIDDAETIEQLEKINDEITHSLLHNPTVMLFRQVLTLKAQNLVLLDNHNKLQNNKKQRDHLNLS